jgi:hypothetical protein
MAFREVGMFEVSGRAFAGATRCDVDAALRLVQVDTGSVIAARQMRQAGNGFDANAARKDAARKLCADVKPMLAAALDERRARGNRVVVEAQLGKGELSDAQALAAALQKLPKVARVDLVRFDPELATFDVVVSGGDGISLALDWIAAPTPSDLPRRVSKVEQSALRLQR